MDRIKTIKYGGAVCGKEERNALIKSIDKSIKNRNWQEADEGKLFTQELCQFLNVKYGVLTSSGSSAGLLALSALEIPKDSEVIISAVTFPTIFNIIVQCGLVPVVVDAKIPDYTFDVEDVERAITPKTKAIIAIHPLGNPVDMPKLMKLAKKYEKQGQKIWVIEDACDALGTTIGGKLVCSFGDVSITSFHAAHIVSMGIGGGVFTNNKLLAQRVRMYRDWGRQADINKSENKKWPQLPKDYNPRFIYEKIGYNFQILDLQAAMGRVQLKKIRQIKKDRKRNFDYLTKHLLKFYDLILPYPIVKNVDICWFAYPITTTGDRGELLRYLEKKGIETRPMFTGNITRHPMCKNIKYRVLDTLEESDYITEHSFWISCHNSLTKSDLKYIIKTFNEYFSR